VLEEIVAASGGDAPAARVAAALGQAGGSAVVLAGPRLADSPGAVSMAVSLAQSLGAAFAFLSRRAGDRGALRAGLHPGLLPGGRAVDDEAERAEVEPLWGAVPGEPGRDARAILEAAARRELDLLYLVGVDVLGDYPDAALAERALANVPFTVVQDISLGPEREIAGAVLPAAAFLEKEGHFTDWEGRGQRITPVRGPEGLSRPDWQIFQELSETLGVDLGFASLEALHTEMGNLLAPRSVSVSPGGSRREPRPETEGLELFTYPLLVDEGRLSVDAHELKAALGTEPFVEVNPADATRLGLSDGDEAVVRTESGQASLPVRVSEGIVEGAAFVPYNQPGFRANVLLSGTTRTTATVEPATAAVEAAG
jgi:NADH-quinone oxidoreductase subunit G